MTAGDIGELHAGAKILQVMDEFGGVSPFGLEARDEDGVAARETFDGAVEVRRRGHLVDADQRRHLAFEGSGQFTIALLAAQVEILQPIERQKRPIEASDTSIRAATAAAVSKGSDWRLLSR
jgi:hypothetical protein